MAWAPESLNVEPSATGAATRVTVVYVNGKDHATEIYATTKPSLDWLRDKVRDAVAALTARDAFIADPPIVADLSDLTIAEDVLAKREYQAALIRYLQLQKALEAGAILPDDESLADAVADVKRLWRPEFGE
ncbi:MAG: hypothetical protein V4529_17490 [Gemmatimonadota bacterium]